MQQWFDGVYLLGQFNAIRCGSWLLANNGEAAILEMPPYDPHEPSPAILAARVARNLDVKVRYLLCTHDHRDHFAPGTWAELRAFFPEARTILQERFRAGPDAQLSERFQHALELFVGGEPLHLIHAPKHSWTDTQVIFRGSACTGDWELNTLKSVHDSWSGITPAIKLAAIDHILNYLAERRYEVHRVFSVHANDRRVNIDFTAILNDTRVPRQLW